jgi:hypothetical protein
VRTDSSMKRRMTGKPKKQGADRVPSGLTETEQNLLSHLQNGYQLETDSLGGDPQLRRLENSEVVRPLSATRNTVKALQERGLIAPAEGDDPLRVVWHLQKTKAAKKSRH